MSNQASLDPKSKHISLGYKPEIPEIASGVNLTLSLPQSPDVQSTFKFARIFDVLLFTGPESYDPEEQKMLGKGCEKFVRVLAKPIFAQLNESWESVLSDACRDYLPPDRNGDKYLRATLRAMSKAARANNAYRSPDSYRIYHHTIPADKTAGDIAVDLYFDLPSEVDIIDSMTAYN